METYHKIHTIFKRDEKGKIIIGDWSRPEFFYLADNEWVWTEKVDGTNIRVIWDSDTKEVCIKGKTDNAQIPTFLNNKLVSLFDIDKELFIVNDLPSLCLYGEGYGARIQKGGGTIIQRELTLFCLM